MAGNMNDESPASTSRPFEYTALTTPTAIRLLSFVDEKGPSAAPSLCGVPLIHRELTTEDLDTDVEYEALSYTWGNPNVIQQNTPDHRGSYTSSDRWPITLNQRLAYVNRSLYEALKHLRHLSRY